MARIFITGSADGLGQMAATSLIKHGHNVVLHARNAARGRDAIKSCPGVESVLIGDLAKIDETNELAHEVNRLGAFDVIIHNAGVYQVSAQELFAVNVLAPYILTCLIQKPKRLIYLSSGMHMQGHSKLDNFKTGQSRINYSDSKLHVLMLCLATARKWPDVYANAVDPGWVPTKMGGPGAPDDLHKGYSTQTWLATSDDIEAKVSGNYFFHQSVTRHNSEADENLLQERFLNLCNELTGVPFPEV